MFLALSDNWRYLERHGGSCLSHATKALLKDMSAALAVLSIYMLTLLVPLHQAAGLQSDFAELGFNSLSTSLICEAVAETETDNDTPTAVNCPVTGAGKTQLALVSALPAIDVALPVETRINYARLAQAPPTAFQSHQSNPRAPPMQA